MSVSDLEVPVDASTATDRDSWLALIDQIGEEEGYFQSLGPNHWAMFVEDGPHLLVSFETIDGARARPGQMPLLHHVAAARGWSHLCLISDGRTWFRDPAVWAYFDRLVDEAFFEDFDSVTFYGAGAGSYPACAFSVAAPGARVLALNPIATLSPDRAAWDDRFKADRRRDFTSRYGFAPDMTEAAAQVTLVCDPHMRLDLTHAALFHGPHCQILRARYGGSDMEAALARLGVLDEVILLAAQGNLTPSAFARLWRKRADDAAYLKHLLNAVEARGSRPRLIALCENVTRRLRLSRFRKRLMELTGGNAAPAKPAETAAS